MFVVIYELNKSLNISSTNQILSKQAKSLVLHYYRREDESLCVLGSVASRRYFSGTADAGRGEGRGEKLGEGASSNITQRYLMSPAN